MKLKAIPVTESVLNEYIGLTKKITDLNNKVIRKRSDVFFIIEWSSRVNGIYVECHYISGVDSMYESEHWYYDLEPNGAKKLYEAIERWEKTYV